MDGNRSNGTGIFAGDLTQYQPPEVHRRSFIDLFAGIGGVHLGMAAAGFEGVFASEIDARAAKVYQANTGLRPHGDITRLDAGLIPEHTVLCAGFPCQAFSVSGNRLGFNDTRGTLFFEVVRIANAKRSPVLLLENVAGLVSHDGGRTLATIKAALDDIGYAVFYAVINAADLGSATARERIFLVAFRQDLNVTSADFRFPAGTGQRRSVADCLVELTTAEISQLRCGSPRAVDRNRLAAVPGLIARCPNQPVRIGTLGKGGQGYRIYSPAGVGITLSAYGGGVAAKTGAYLIDGVVRRLHPRECANLMDFPADFVLDPRPAQALKQLGNSVAVGAVTAIAREIQRTLDRVATRDALAVAGVERTHEKSDLSRRDPGVLAPRPEVPCGKKSVPSPTHKELEMDGNRSNQTTYVTADFFAGIGAFTLGAENTGRVKTVFSCEKDPHAQTTYAANFDAVTSGDILALDPATMPDVDIVLGGPPCQDFSAMGKRAGLTGDRGSLTAVFGEILRVKRPLAFVMENVKGLLSSKGGEDFARVREQFSQAGYALFAKVCDAADYGVAQRRERLIVVGLRKDLNATFVFPKGVGRTATLESVLEQDVPANYFLSQAYAESLKARTERNSAKGNGFGMAIPNLGGVANTLTVGGSGRERNLIAATAPAGSGKANLRRLTPRECLRLQGFPETFKLPVSDTQAYKQTGNTVAVPVVEAIVGELVKVLDKALEARNAKTEVVVQAVSVETGVCSTAKQFHDAAMTGPAANEEVWDMAA